MSTKKVKKSSLIKQKLKGQTPLKIDFGCGKNKRQPDADKIPWIGVDEIKFEGVDVVMHVGKDKWPWKDNSVDEAHASHFVEHLTAQERIHFVNELYRVLKPESKFTMIVPHWNSCRAYGDLTHVWPPVSEFWFYYLKKEWRDINAPHNNFYTCNFEVTWGYNLEQSLTVRAAEQQQFAIQNYKEACQDIVATFIKKQL